MQLVNQNADQPAQHVAVERKRGVKSIHCLRCKEAMAFQYRKYLRDERDLLQRFQHYSTINITHQPILRK
jgi:hypothetical protein